MTLAQRLKAARAALGLSQKAVAEQSGVSARGYQGYEDGRSVPGGDAIAGLVRLGINANWLLTGEGPMLLADLVAPAPAVPPRALTAKINVDALEAIIEGAMKVARNAPASAIAAHVASVYVKCIEDGLITPDGIGEGAHKNAA